ncbi:iron-containing alcohol dehydrogenase [Clostridia bacterium]|nr:iron-containing alcohol dehydrogenase [Clostridia bacterium]
MQAFYSPTRIIAGDGAVAGAAGLIQKFGKTALLVTGKASARVSGALDDVIRVLKANGQDYALFDRVGPNPSVETVFAGAAFSIEHKCDFCIGIGGGSPLDAAKAIAAFAAETPKKEDVFLHIPKIALRLVAIPTTAGTGSEVTQYAILTNDQEETKTSIASDALFPALALLDPRYTVGLSVETTVNTAIDALSHAAEGMLSVKAGEITDALAIDALGLISSRFSALRAGEFTEDDRRALLLAACLAGQVIANTGTTAVHALGYSLTYDRHIDHGRANGLVMGAFLRAVEAKSKRSVARILRAMRLKSTEDFCVLLEDLFGKVSLTDGEVSKYARKAAKTKNMKNLIVSLNEEELSGILTASRAGGAYGKVW